MIGNTPGGGLQATFVPKKPLVISRSQSKPTYAGLLMIVSSIIFVVALLTYGGTLIYKKGLETQIADAKTQLIKVQKSLADKASLVEDMVKLDQRIKISEDLLNKHTSLSPLFTFFSESAKKNLRYNDFNYTNKDNEKIELRMGGEAKSYSTIALEENEFAATKNFTDIVFSDLNPGLTGNVVFKLSALVKPSIVLYSEMVKGNR